MYIYTVKLCWRGKLGVAGILTFCPSYFLIDSQLSSYSYWSVALYSFRLLSLDFKFVNSICCQYHILARFVIYIIHS